VNYDSAAVFTNIIFIIYIKTMFSRFGTSTRTNEFSTDVFSSHYGYDHRNCKAQLQIAIWLEVDADKIEKSGRTYCRRSDVQEVLCDTFCDKIGYVSNFNVNAWVETYNFYHPWAKKEVSYKMTNKTLELFKAFPFKKPQRPEGVYYILGGIDNDLEKFNAQCDQFNEAVIKNTRNILNLPEDDRKVVISIIDLLKEQGVIDTTFSLYAVDEKNWRSVESPPTLTKQPRNRSILWWRGGKKPKSKTAKKPKSKNKENK